MSAGQAVGLLLLGGFGAGFLTLAAVTGRARRLRLVSGPAHELRGALSALGLAVSGLERSAGSPQTVGDYADTIRAQIERARLAVEDLDALREVRPLHCAAGGKTFELPALVLKSARAWSMLAPSYGARLEADWRAGSARVRGDGARLSQALDNLIANALEHGAGRVRVEGHVRGETARIAVRDGGSGLPRQLEEMAEAPWHSVHGHGLALARRAVEAHGGRLRAESGTEGAALVIELPVERADGGRAPRAA